ncbi:MAG: peptidase [Verrucomicrobia bacterium]|nr:MAG: peptidase [Verrucomicrobiota bacterium]
MARASTTEYLLHELIALPSVNPAFLPPDNPRTGEGRVAEFLKKAAFRAGLETDLQNVLPERSNLIVRLSPTAKPRQRILLAPHLDTVGASDNQFTPRQKNGRIFGRGACDTKGSVAAMFSALCEMALKGPRPRQTEIVFAGLVDEENAQTGSRTLAARGPKADLAIVGEATRLQVVTAHKGSLWLRLETRGKSAHGAHPELGRNAIRMMAQVVEILEGDYAEKLRQRTHPLLGHATVNVGSINGGVQANIVPDSCAILLDRRTLPGETEAGVVREIGAFLRTGLNHSLRTSSSSSSSSSKPIAKRATRNSSANEELNFTITGGKDAPCLPLETDPTLPLVKQFLANAAQHRPVGVHYFCDASVLAHGGIPSIVFGPGDIAQAHTADEWISVSQLNRAQALLLRFLRSLP